MVISKEDEVILMSLNDWRKAIRTPPSYRVGNSTIRMQSPCITFCAVVGLIFFFYLFNSGGKSGEELSTGHVYMNIEDHQKDSSGASCNGDIDATYPLTKPVHTKDGIQFRIGLVTDLDHSSKSKIESNTWVSYFLKGFLLWNPKFRNVSVSWDSPGYSTLKTSFSHKGRGMELSELVTFDGKLLTFDDRSGIVYVIKDDGAYPWVLLSDGDGTTNKGFKGEWAAVKGGYLYIGSMGKEWTTSKGVFVNTYPMWVKKIGKKGDVQSLDWKENYTALRSAVGITFPGYMLHESGTWSDHHQKWFFLPRRMSHEQYDEVKDEFTGTNVLLSCDEHFKNVNVVHVGKVEPTHGFSSFKFIPGTDDTVIVALKTTEVEGQTSTFIMVFDIHGNILHPEKKIADLKYEGFDFI